jgi:hypothetical protein
LWAVICSGCLILGCCPRHFRDLAVNRSGATAADRTCGSS